MRTAEEMAKYCEEHGTGSGFNKKWTLKHFQVIEKQLKDDEEVEVCFIGLKDYISLTKHKNNWAYAITDDRIIIGQKGLIGESVDFISLRNLNDISFKKGIALGVLTFDTIKEEFNVGLDKFSAENIHKEVSNYLMDKTENINKIENAHIENTTSDPYEEVKKLKDLLDMGIITEEEFDNKKNSLLGL